MFSVLVADDEKNTRILAKAVLESAGYNCILAKNGQEALNILDKNHVDIILLDVMMPEMDGYEFCRQLRENNIDIPVLMVSAKQMPEDIKMGFLSGTDDFMKKPVDEEDCF